VKFNKAIVTSGPTREWIDPVRFISNASSGKMGYHIANELQKWIPNTVYIYGNVLEKYREFQGVKKQVETTIEMLNAILEELQDNTLIIMAAAPADFRPQNYIENKIKKKSEENYSLNLVQNPDILVSVSQEVINKNYKSIHKIGFAAETNNLDENARDKINKKGLDYIIANYVGREKGFGEAESSVKIISGDGLQIQIENLSKEEISIQVVNFLRQKYES
jgi:phosphopantothenoylcysteine synthetase/decarboxylase